MPVRVISYNVLSSELVDPERFALCSEEDLDSDRRYQEIEKILSVEVDRKSIICLQEVSLTWAARLHVFFAPRNYRVVKAQFSSIHSGYMGCLTAFPHDVYKLVDCKYLSPFHTTLTAPKPSFLRSLVKSATGLNQSWLLPALAAAPCAAWVADALLGTQALAHVRQWGLPFCAAGASLSTLGTVQDRFFPEPSKFEDPNLVTGIEARHRDVVPMVRLKQVGLQEEFWVANTHMPCKHFNQKLMAAFAWHIGVKVQGVAESLPYILVGDFNAKPTGVVYEMYTMGSVPPGHPDRPSFPAEEGWEPKLAPMRSAYAARNGCEPKFTNWSQISIGGVLDDPFIEVLDYIWLSPDWKVESVDELPGEPTGVASFPSKAVGQPSDHVLIGANLIL